MMEGEADHWWRAAKNTRSLLRGNGDWTWREFLDVFYKKYFPVSVREKKEVEFITLEQGNLTVAAYEAKFSELSRFAPHMIATEAMRAKKFERGLRPYLRSQVSMFRHETYAEVYDKAELVEINSDDYF